MSNAELALFTEELTGTVELRFNEGTREIIRADLSAVQEWITGSSGVPVLTGALRSSFTPYVGTAPTDHPPPDQPFYAIQGDDAVDRVVDLMQPGETVGTVSNLPYSARVTLGGHSSKFPEGQFDIGLAQALEGSHRK